MISIIYHYEQVGLKFFCPLYSRGLKTEKPETDTIPEIYGTLKCVSF